MHSGVEGRSEGLVATLRAVGSAPVQPQDACLVQVPPQGGFQQQVMVCVEFQGLLLPVVIVVRVFLVVVCDKPIGTDLDTESQSLG